MTVEHEGLPPELVNLLSTTDDVFHDVIIASEGRGDQPHPTAIGPYTVIKKLGTGGMGDVFLVEDEALTRKVALKRIRPDRWSSEEMRRLFDVEARVTGLLQHPSIISVYHYFPSEGEAYYTMQPILGITLRELLGRLRGDQFDVRQQWPTVRLVRLFLQAANAVAHAHSRGVIHRDLKPANIMIGPFEQVLVLDWGVAMVLPEAAQTPPFDELRELIQETLPGGRVGTPAYMAPEQHRGETASVRTDIYALGIILYELLALRHPWRALSSEEFHEAKKFPPENPTRLQPARGIPSELGEVALRAIGYEPEQRFASVSEFSTAVSRALEGRATWRPIPGTTDPATWRIAGARLIQEGPVIVLRCRGPGGTFRYFCSQRPPDDVRVAFDLNVPRGTHELSVWLNTENPRGEPLGNGYNLAVLPGRRRTLSLWRSGRLVAGARSPQFEHRRWYRVAVTREDDRFSLRIDGEEIYVYHDPIPQSGGFVGLTGRTHGIRIRNLRVSSLGTSATVSCLAVPDAFFNRKLYDEALAEYKRIAASLPGRDEGRLAGFRAGLSLLEIARSEEDDEVRAFIHTEANEAFARLTGPNESCLASLGRAMVASDQKKWREKRQALETALELYPDDPHITTVNEWLLGQLHDVDQNDRQKIAELLPLAIGHCMDDVWGRRVVRDLVKDIRKQWEIPSFMSSRGAFRENDRVSQAELKLFFAFWSGGPRLIEKATLEILNAQALRPHHAADAVFSLIELGHAEKADELLTRLDTELQVGGGQRGRQILSLCRAATYSSQGDADAAQRALREVEPDPSCRIFNSARLCVARTVFEGPQPYNALKIMRPITQHDTFAREHQAWFCLCMGDPKRADKHLRYFLQRNDHRSGKNLSNFLHGVSLIQRGQQENALVVFKYLDAVRWPRSWTLGSHYALGRLGGGDMAAYLKRSFPWERINLERHAALLADTAFTPPTPLP